MKPHRSIRILPAAFRACFAGSAALFLLPASPVQAGSATWQSAPVNGDWNTAGNWIPNTIPNGPADVASFGTAATTAIRLSASTEVDTILFSAGASAFTITARPTFTLTLSGAGIVNEFGVVQKFSSGVSDFSNAGGKIQFAGSATAGSLTTFTNSGRIAIGGFEWGGTTQFNDTSSAGNATFVNQAGAAGGGVLFFDASSAGNGNFTNQGGAVSGGNANGGFVQFRDSSSAGTGTFTTNGGTASRAGGGSMRFFDMATAGSGAFIVNGGTVVGASGGKMFFINASSAGEGTFTINGGEKNSGVVRFFNDSDAGSGNFTTNGGSTVGAFGGYTLFTGRTSAGDGTFTTNGGTADGAFGGVTSFSLTASAGNGTFITNGRAIGGAGDGLTQFFDSSSAGHGMFTNNADGYTQFFENSTAALGTFKNIGGITEFFGTSTAGDGTFTNSEFGSTRFFDSASAGRGTFTVNHGSGTQFLHTSTAGSGTFTIYGGSMQFSDSASAGSGIFTNRGRIGFLEASSAGSGTFTTNGGARTGIKFSGTASADNGIFITNGGTVSGASGGYIYFTSKATAGSGTFTTNGGRVSGGLGGFIHFFGLSSAGSGTFTVNGGEASGAGGGFMQFIDRSSTGSATLIATGGANGGEGGGIYYGEATKGGTERVAVFGNGRLDISRHDAPGVSIGSVEGDGDVFLGANKLTVGGTGLSTGFFGVIQDGGAGGSLTKVGSGTLTLGGNNTYAGATAIDGGALAIFADYNLGAGALSLNDGELRALAGLTLERDIAIGAGGGAFDSGGFDSTLGGVLSGTGAFAKTGAGTLTLSGASTFTADTNIIEGTLFVDGSLASANVNVLAAGLLGGNGVLLGNVANGGAVSPGRSVGTLNVGGDFSQTGALFIEIASATSFDKLLVGGRANLGGAVRFVPLGGFQPKVGERIEFLTAGGGISGTFQSVGGGFTGLGALVKLEVVYGANGVALVGAQNSFANALGIGAGANPFGLTPNQISVARALDSALTDPRQGAVLGFLNNADFASLPHQLDLIAPEELAAMDSISFSLANVQNLHLQRRMDDIRAGSNGFSAAGFAVSGGVGAKTIIEAAPDHRWGVFVTGLGEVVDVDGTHNASGYDLSTGGITLGLDYRVRPGFAVGVNAGYANTDADLVDGGRVTVDGGKLGAYATFFTPGGFYVDAALGGGRGSYETRRSALEGHARGDTDGTEWNALLGTGYDWKKGALTIGPTVTFQYTRLDIDGFRERGSLAPLDIEGRSAASARLTGGVKASYDLEVGRVRVRPELRAAWQHEYGDREAGIDARFANGAGNSFTVEGPSLGRESLLLGAGVVVQISARFSTHLYYDGQLARTGYDSHTLSAGVRLAF